MEDIKVTVVAYPDRTNLVLRYIDPMTGKQKSKSAKTSNRKAAEKAAGKWESELREGRYQSTSKATWADFRERYDDEALTGLADTTARKVLGVFNSIEAILSPARLRDVTESRLSFYQSELRRLGKSENTIKGHLAHLKSALRWAERVGLLPKAPKIAMPKRAKGAKMMKGRPITGEEFDRLLAKVEAIVGKDRAASWKRYLRGLWLSGLRLAESLELCWDRDDKLCVDLSGKRPMLRIPAALEKGNQDRLLPVAPEFAEFLPATAEDERTGYVFDPAAQRVHGERLTPLRVCHVVSKIGAKAGVKVSSKWADKVNEGTGKDEKVEVVKFASAHDLRRSFGERWSSRVMPQVLMELMRHDSIDTTLKFYVGRNAQTTADVLWAAHEKAAGNISGNSGQNPTSEATDAADANACRE